MIKKNAKAMKEAYEEILEIWEPLASIKLENPESGPDVRPSRET
jgi:hypothetical protein